MSTLYLVVNGAAPLSAPLTPVLTSSTHPTVLQVVPSANTPIDIVEWGFSFNGSALATPFSCDLCDTGTVAATVTAYASADIMPFDDPGAPANSAGTSGVPLNLGTALSGYTSTAEGTVTAVRVFDVQQIDPAAGYYKQFPLGARPRIKPGDVCRIRCNGDGVRTVAAYMIFDV